MSRHLILLAATALAGSAVITASAIRHTDTSVNERLLQYLDPSQSARLACRGTGASQLAAAFRASKAHAESHDTAQQTDMPPLYEGLGKSHINITTNHPMAQAYFDQGMRFSFAFNHREAARAFRAAQTYDPQCAMCYWGEALVLGPNINAPMAEEATVPTLKALAMAKEYASQTTKPEQALIEALDARYTAYPGPDRSPLDKAYAEAMIKTAKAFPDLDYIQLLAAEAIMDAQPWAYWEPDKATPAGHAGEAIAMVEAVLKRNPGDAGAIHLYIHLVEASTTPERAESYADRLAALMPSAGHIVHMPSHLYYRIGRYQDAITANRKAIAADETYFRQAGREGIYGFGYYPHNVHFALTSAQMAGDEETAAAMAEKLQDLIPVEAALGAPAFMQPIMVAPLFARAQFPEISLPDGPAMPDERLPYVRAMWHYAQGARHIMADNMDDADRDIAAIMAIRDNADFSAMEDGGAPAHTILDIAIHVLQGRKAMAMGEYKAALPHFKAAAALQDSLPYMEPPYWYYPVRQSLGAAQLLADMPNDAVGTLRQSLYTAPNNGYVLYALTKAEQARGEAEAAKAAKRAYKKAWLGKTEPNLQRM